MKQQMQFKLRQDLFKRRQDAAQMFEDRKVSIGALAPQVAQQDAITKTSTTVSTSTSRCYRYSRISTIFNTSPNTSRSSAGTTLGAISLGAPQQQQIDISCLRFNLKL